LAGVGAGLGAAEIVVVPVVVDVVGAVVVTEVVAGRVAPLATDSVTTEPFAAWLPALGNSPTTWPRGFVDETGARTTRKPRFASVAWAESNDRPVTTGTSIRAGTDGLPDVARVTSTVVVDPLSRWDRR
jgi:hypothetical protein